MAILRNIVVKIGADISGLQKSLTDASKSLDKAGKSISSIGGKLTTGLTLPIAAATGGILKLGTDFDNAFDKIRVGTGATGEALKGLQSDFKSVYSSVPSGMAEVSTAISDLNVRTRLAGKPLQELSAQMLNLSRISGEDLSGMIAGSTRLFGDWSISAGKTGSTMDYLFRVSQSTGIGFNDLNAKLVQFGAPLRQMGFDLETSAALLGKFEKEGVNTELVLGGLRIALGKMAKAGITDTKEALIEVTRQIKEAGSTGEANAIALEMFGARIGPDMAAAIREGRFELGELLSTLKSSGETINNASFETLDFAEKLTVMKNKLAVALEPLGSSLLQAINVVSPAIEGLINKLTGLVDWFVNLKASSKMMILYFIGIAAAIGPILTIIGAMVKTIGSVMLWGSGVAKAFGLVQKGTKGMGYLMTAVFGPAGVVMLVIASIAVLIAGLIYLWNTNEAFRSAVISIWKTIVSAVTPILNSIKDTAITVFMAIQQFITTNLGTIKSIITSSMELIKIIVGAALTWLSTQWQIWGTVIKPVITAIWEAIKGVVKTAWDLISGIAGAGLTVLSGIFSVIVGILNGDWKRAWNGAKSIVEGVWSGIKTVVKGGINFVIRGINAMISGLNKLKIKVPKIPGITDGFNLGFNISKIPELAKGGIATGPTLAMIGEGYEDEAILPLSKLEAMLGVNGKSKGNEITININLNNPVVREDQDINKITERINKSLKDLMNKEMRGGMVYDL
ncbi:MAG: phage tail tape measure protein [Eubacteriaceae bacterium]|nr:phage tail tape measure protein [Eubacteriaceae bacterium]